MSKTLTMIKPTAFEQGHSGKIIDRIIEAGFSITAMKMMHLTLSQAQNFYKVHQGRPFYDALTNYMSEGPIIAAILEKENAVDDYRKLIGNTDPAKADKNTIRNLYGTSIQANAVHGSDSDENAEIECSFFFSQTERFTK